MASYALRRAHTGYLSELVPNLYHYILPQPRSFVPKLGGAFAIYSLWRHFAHKLTCVIGVVQDRSQEDLNWGPPA
eukprot:364394-Pelagomonas_calceolata.AAC.1